MPASLASRPNRAGETERVLEAEREALASYEGSRDAFGPEDWRVRMALGDLIAITTAAGREGQARI